MRKARLTTRLNIAVVGTVTACVLAACGGGGGSDNNNSGGNSSGNSGGNNANSAEGFTATSIKIEGDIVKTSAVGYSQAGAETGRRPGSTAPIRRAASTAARSTIWAHSTTSSTPPRTCRS